MRNLRARRRAGGEPVEVRGEPGAGECPVAGKQVFQDGRFQGGLAGEAGGCGGVAGPDQQGGHPGAHSCFCGSKP